MQGQESEGLWAGQEGTPWSTVCKERKNCMLSLSCTPPNTLGLSSANQPERSVPSSLIPLLPCVGVLVYVHTCTNLHIQGGQPKQQGFLGVDPAIDLEKTNSPRATSPTHPPAMVPDSQVWEAGREASQNREHILFFILPLRTWGLLIK